MNFVEWSIAFGLLAAQAPYRGPPPVVYVPPGCAKMTVPRHRRQ